MAKSLLGLLRIDLNDSAGGTKNNQDLYEIFEELDKNLVGMGIEKTSNMNNFELLEERLDPEYANRLKSIISNIN